MILFLNCLTLNELKVEYDTTRIYYLKMLINKDKETVIWQR